MDEAERKFDRAIASRSFRLGACVLVVMAICAIGVFAREFFLADDAFTLKSYVRGWLVAFPFLACAFGGVIIAGLSFLRRTGSDRVVVWLRRFHQQEPSRFPLPRMFTLAGMSNFQVVTIQDSRFQRSFATGMQSGAGCLIALVVILIGPIMLISLIITGLFINVASPLFSLGDWGKAAGFIAIYLIVFNAFLIPIGRAVVRRRGSVILNEARGIDQIARWIEKVQSGSGHVLPGLKIFKCADSFWMDAVELMLTKCDAAIIDISDLNENMRWELGQCAEKVSPYKLVLAYSVPPESFPADPPDWLYDEIAESIGHRFAQYAIWMPYPEPLSTHKNRPVADNELFDEAASHVSGAVDLALGRRGEDEAS